MKGISVGTRTVRLSAVPLLAGAVLAILAYPVPLHTQEPAKRPIYFDGQVGWQGANEIMALDLRTRKVSRLTFSNHEERGPAQTPRTSRFAAPSPDGNRVAFMSDMHGEGKDDIYIMDRDGGNVRRITWEPDRYFGAPTWSPDGASIAFNEISQGVGVIYVMNSDGSGIQRLTPESLSAFFPSWSPDGRSIAFSGSGSSNDNIDVFVIDVASRQVRRISNHPAIDRQPDWSPDGRQLVFDSNRDDGNWELYIMNSDGSEVRRLTDHPAVDTHAAWSPYGDRVVFHSTRQQKRLRPNGRPAAEIYTISTDGSGLTRLAFDEASYAHPDW